MVNNAIAPSALFKTPTGKLGRPLTNLFFFLSFFFAKDVSGPKDASTGKEKMKSKYIKLNFEKSP